MSIINPCVFYAIGIIYKLGAVIDVIMIATVIVIVILAIFCGMTYCFDELTNGWWNNKTKKAAKTAFIVLTIMCLISAFWPSKETMYQMLVANYVTYDVVEDVGGGLKTVVDYIVAAAKELTTQ